jgi:hypothetical protein
MLSDECTESDPNHSSNSITGWINTDSFGMSISIVSKTTSSGGEGNGQRNVDHGRRTASGALGTTTI